MTKSVLLWLLMACMRLFDVLSEVSFHKFLDTDTAVKFYVDSPVFEKFDLPYLFQSVDTEDVLFGVETEQFREPIRSAVQLPDVVMDNGIKNNLEIFCRLPCRTLPPVLIVASAPVASKDEAGD